MNKTLPVKTILSLVSLAAATAAPVQAEMLGSYEFGDFVANTGSLEASLVAPDISFSAVSRSGLPDNGFYTSQTEGGGQTSRFLVTKFFNESGLVSISPETARDANVHFQFTVTPTLAQTIAFDSMTLNATRGGGAARGFAVGSSADNYATFLGSTQPATGIETQSPVYTSYSVDLSSISSSDPVTFRVYLWSSATFDAMYFENVTVNAIPEPSTYAAIFGVGVLGLAILRRRWNR